jgi:signal transduction histidine kinase
MADDAPHGLRVLRTPDEVLKSAVARVGERIETSYPFLASGGTIRAQGYLRTIEIKLLEVLEGRSPEPLSARVASNALFEPLMRVLSRELIMGACENPDAAPSALLVLRALISLEGPPEIDRATEADDDPEGLKANMSGADAFELLVEVAHDFRSPLTSILFLAEALRDSHSGPVTDAQRSQLGLIYSAAFGLASIASDVMDLARQERDLIQDDTEAFALTELFAHVERLVRPIVEEKGLELQIVVPERWHARGHRHALSRVLLNLTTNALKFTDSGSVEIGVVPRPHGRLEYYVQDTGRGITPEQRRRLFEPFKRRSGGGRYFSGSGVGLSIARRLLQAMGSELSLDSSDAHGSRFSFTLPSGSAGSR